MEIALTFVLIVWLMMLAHGEDKRRARDRARRRRRNRG